VPGHVTNVGDLKPGEAAEAPSAFSPQREARALVLEHAGAVAFSRAGDPSTGEFHDAGRRNLMHPAAVHVSGDGRPREPRHEQPYAAGAARQSEP
jgi:hypothetical protein